MYYYVVLEIIAYRDRLTQDYARNHSLYATFPDALLASATCSQGSSSSSLAPVPNIYPGVMTEEEKVQTQNQRAMYRRLFMDIEREQVRKQQIN